MNKSMCVSKFGSILLAGCLLLLTGCNIVGQSDKKIKDLEFTVISQERLSDELLDIIEERKSEAFKLTYHDGDYLYLVVGYGEQPTGGYSISVNELYLTDNAIYVSTSLLGPDTAPRSNGTPSYPCIVIKTEYLDKTVIFE